MTPHRFFLMLASRLRGAAVPSLTAFTLAAVSGYAPAQADQPDFRACRGIADNLARLTCYDALTYPGEQGETKAVQAAAPEPEPAAPATVTIASFGAPPPRLEASADGEAELVDTVSAIEELAKGKVRITLSNGQVWTQSISKSFFLRERDAVRISRSPWGGTFRLHKDGKPGYIQVERLR